ncbi:MAG TPA: 6-carboxytetrahydropterin synthase [Bacteroidales bacterium]|jgi:6-pyruvoyltetrahydropterin/6-carboxytetrahydropterin synthase|nr:6-carboxytetrahydropterin synthase [Bacteroidales bacterium]MDI9574435.1 6-carboxytetrahydropterin synthase [Bacteroidota bacterium]MBP9511724.1 6-carboxytetrahydropterin synthase [Bacteroidales bacterium]MBP9588732.1 6-carboxytetrahydropterin synthase [Bacteroidales bacterium]NMD16609.1 6-carboxytetrahydropterin synthase [Bacteroidales bacterium]
MIYLTRRETFNAAHRLFRPEYSDEKNLEIFGKCSNPNWHGHNYTLYITVKGIPNSETGMAINLKELSQIIQKYIIEKVDHKNLNTEVDFMYGRMTSIEMIAIAFWEQLKQPILAIGAQLYKIRLEETENNFVEYFGQ